MNAPSVAELLKKIQTIQAECAHEFIPGQPFLTLTALEKGYVVVGHRESEYPKEVAPIIKVKCRHCQLVEQRSTYDTCPKCLGTLADTRSSKSQEVYDSVYAHDDKVRKEHGFMTGDLDLAYSTVIVRECQNPTCKFLVGYHVYDH